MSTRPVPANASAPGNCAEIRWAAQGSVPPFRRFQHRVPVPVALPTFPSFPVLGMRGPSTRNAASQLVELVRAAKGGAPCSAHPNREAASTNSIFPISRRNSCGVIRTIATSSLARSARVAVNPRPSPRGEGRDHGALNFLVDPSLSADVCPAIWRPEDNPGVVLAAHGLRNCSLFKAALSGRPVLVDARTQNGHHLVLAGKRARHRILIGDHGDRAGYIVRADRSMPFALAALGAFHENRCGPRAAAARTILMPTAYQRHRLALLVSILDRLEQSASRGATIRQIAGELVFPGQTFDRAIDWKSSSHRRQTQRLVAEARRMMATGYRDLLRGCMRSQLTVGSEPCDADSAAG